MKYLALILIVILGFGCSTHQHATSERLGVSGTWIPVKQEMNGTPLPAVVYEKQKLILEGNNYTMIAESVDKGNVEFNKNRIEIHGKDGVNAGKIFKAIYRMDDGQLTICYDLTGEKYPESFDTKGNPMYFLSVFRKE